jgi:aromatic ring-opening dioxygenase catalytic subunit (LigB family)
MVALHCFDPMARQPVNKELVSSAKSMSKKIMDKFVDMSILTDKQFKELYDMAKKIELNDSDKLIVTVLAGSSITGRLKELKKHKYDSEVCFSDLITGNQ